MLIFYSLFKSNQNLKNKTFQKNDMLTQICDHLNLRKNYLKNRYLVCLNCSVQIEKCKHSENYYTQEFEQPIKDQFIDLKTYVLRFYLLSDYTSADLS